MTTPSNTVTNPVIARPSTAAPSTAVQTLAGSPDACRAYSMIRRPTPPRSPVEISATTTPTTDADAANRSAGMRYGTADGNRSLNITCRLLAA